MVGKKVQLVREQKLKRYGSYQQVRENGNPIQQGELNRVSTMMEEDKG